MKQLRSLFLLLLFALLKGVDDYYKPSITPSANRNSYRVAIIVMQLPRVADYARNPGLGNRNSVRVAAA